MSSLKWIVLNDEYNGQDSNIEEVSVSDIRIEVEDNATNLLYTKNEPVNLISIFGQARMGKSTFMNILAGVDNYDNEIFKTSSDSETVTTGVDISKIFVPLKEFSKFNDNPEIDSSTLIGFVDTEGQGNKGEEFDIYLFSPILAISKIVIFWWPALLQVDSILNSLGAMTNSAKRITKEAQCQHQNTKPYGHLHIIFRSWNNKETPERVKNLLLESKESSSKKGKEHNNIRELLNDSFESIDIWLFPTNGPKKNENLLFEDFNDNWKQTFKDMHKKFSDQLSVNEPKHGAEKPWTGRDIAEFTKLLCKTLTSSENYAINSIFERMQIVRAKTLAKNAIDEFRVIVYEMNPQYKVDGCDSVGIDACLYEKLKSFEETLKWESFSHNVIKEIYEDYNKTISLIADEIKTKIAALTIKVQNLQNQFDESVSTIVLPLSKSDLTMALNEKVMQLWGYFDDMIKDFPKGFIKQHRENLNNFCKEKSQQITAENEKTYAINDFRILVNEMNPLYKVEGCNFEGIDAYLYEELKLFKEKLKTESFSDNIANEIYADYKKTICFIVSEIKIKIGTLTIETQNLQNRFDKSASIIMLPLSKSDLTKVLNELTRRLWCDFDDMAKEFPKGFVQQHRKRLENFCEEKNQYIAADNEKINALNDFCTLVNEMNPRHKEEGCDSEGIDAYLYEELKIFKAKLKSEGFSDNIVNEIYSDYKKTVKLIVREIKIKITALTVEVQNFQNRFVESVSNIVLPLSKSDLTKSLNEKITQLWNDFDDMVKDFPKGFVQQHRKMLEIFCKEKNHYIAAENEKINALNDFRELINEMNPQHKAEGCDSEGIDAYLYEELKNFKEKLKSEGLSDNIVNEIYADYDKTICLIASETKNKTIMLTVELQSFQDRLDRYEKTISIVEEPLKKSDLTASLNELIQESWIDFDNMVRDFPRGFTDFVQKHREKFEKFCKEKNQHITAENEKKIILYAQKNTKQSLRKLVKKLKKRLPMTQEKLCFEWTKLLTQIEELYLNLYEFFDATFPDDLHIITNPFWELLREDNSKAWKNKAEVFRERAKVLFKGAFATNFPINDKKIFNHTEIEHYFQEEILRFSYNVSNIFPYTMMDDICNKYKENIRSIAMNFQEKNNKNIKKISQKIEQHIIEWDILIDANIRRYLERWQHEVTELLLNSNAIPELATLPSFQLLYICNDITDLNRETIPSSFRNIIKSIIGRDMGDILFEQFVITILEGLESNELKSAQMSFINRCLGITALTFPIRQLFYKRLFVHKPFMFAGPIIWRIFLAEYEKYQNERHRNAFFDLISNSQMVFDVLPDLKVINDLLKGNDQDSPIAALSCDIIQKTFFAHYELTELHHNFSEAINSISTNNIEPLQNISAIAFLKEYVRAFYDANKEHLRTFRNVSMMEMPVDTNMAEIIRDINNQLESGCPKLHLLKVYFLKYLRFCNFSMQDIKDLCESQMQTFPWLNEIPWENNENWLSFNPYWLHQNYKIVEEYYSNIYDCSKYDDNNMCFTAFLERRNRVNRMLQLLGILNQPLTKNDLVIFAGVIAARLHYIRASRELTVYEKRIIKYLIEETTTMNASPAYKEIFRKLLLNTNPLIQLLNENEVNRVNNEVNEFFMKSVIVHLLIVHASIPNNASPLAAYLHQLQGCQNDFILTCPSDVGGVVMNAMASGTGGGVTRYQCVCGEIFFVEDCGNFGKPEERPSESVSGRCLFCKRLIGYGSNQNDYKRLDSGKVTSVPINHKSGYIVEQIATEKTHNVRMMTPQAYRILHLFVHTILCSSAPSSVTSQFFAKNEFHETDEENAPSSSSTAQNARASYYLQTVQIQNAQPANFIDYDWNDEILQLSQRNLEIRYGEDIVYNLLHIEMELANQLVFNKALINSNFNTSFPFYKEMFFRKFYILTDISDFVAQEPLPTANINVYGHVLDESFSSENASRMLPALEMLICSINCQIDGETSIKDYISQQMDLTILTENADFCGMFSTDLRLKHLISLYERVERAMTYTFDNIDVKYKEPLSQRMERRIINVIDFENRFQNRISACELLTALKRFLVRYLMVESLTSIPTSDELTNYIIDENFGCWPSNNSLEIANNLFPSAIRVDQTFSVYELINFGQISSNSSE
ncbi:28125_t:CDS:2 [Gigaspora margarita]|uniref:28125_t:CDS:1 n=1 Tax=Gigaspora margarita TaxID=4874 RepID=A0ABN7USG9_GIGMA|nr:28125_t:CDS:2 [Gigaspora margarita]